MEEAAKSRTVGGTAVDFGGWWDDINLEDTSSVPNAKI